MSIFGSAPKAPDPYQTANAQYDLNKKTAQENQRLGMTGQTTAYGSLDWVSDPNSPSGYRAVQSLSPEEQALLGQRQQLQGQAMGNVGQTLGQPFDLNASRANELVDMQRTFLDPQWAQQQDAFRTDLMNRGIREGSEQWANALRNFDNSRNSAYNSMYLDSWSKANDAALTERNLPLQDYSTLSGLAGQQTPLGLMNTSAPQIDSPDLMSAINSKYAADSKAYSDKMNGIFGLAGTLGGWALSDKRLKEDIEKIGEDPRGWNVYKFRYRNAEKNNETLRLGFMADEVERVRPDAVFTSPHTGLKMVDYEKLAA